MVRVHVVGLDGVPPRLVEAGIEQGRLPTFEVLRSEGVEGTTQSTVPPVSMMAWSTFATGMDPGNHGIFNFLLKDESGYDTSFVDATMLRSNAAPIWEYLDAQGIRSGVMNVMPGYPVSRTRGFHVSDYITTPSTGPYAHPPTLQDHIETNHESFEIGPPTGFNPGDGPDALRSYVDRFFEVERDRITLTKHLVAEYDCPATFLVFSGPDVFLHEVGYLLDEDHPKYDRDEAEALDDAHLKLLGTYDQFLAWLLERMAPDDVLLVLSDHGHGPIYTSINLNSWLYRNGYFELKKGIWTRLKQFGYNHVYDSFEGLLKRLGLYGRLKEGLARTSSDGSGRNLAGLLTLSQGDVDWEETSAFTVAGDGQVYVNTSDHVHGAITESGYEELREGLRRDLLEVKHPDRGGQVIEAVYDGEEVYADGHATTRPDLVCVPAPTYRITFPQTMKTATPFGEPAKYASHTSCEDRTGIFYAGGPRVRPSSGMELQLEDFAPTVLSLLELPIPEMMDGRSQAGALGIDVESFRSSQQGLVDTKRAVRSIVDGLRDEM